MATVSMATNRRASGGAPAEQPLSPGSGSGDQPFVPPTFLRPTDRSVLFLHHRILEHKENHDVNTPQYNNVIYNKRSLFTMNLINCTIYLPKGREVNK